MESTSTKVPIFVLNKFDNIPECQVPFLCEVWNWQGDTSVLPHKWVEVLNNVSGIGEGPFSTKMVKQNYVSQSTKFDPNAFFFLTYRSHAIGLCLAWPISNGEFEIKYLCSVPSHRNKGVEEALLSLVLEYCKSKGATKVTLKFDEPHLYDYQSSVIPSILTEKFNFSLTK